jgi:hypothetical protein
MLRQVKPQTHAFVCAGSSADAVLVAASQRRQRANVNAQPSPSGQAQKVVEQGGHVPEFSRLRARQLKGRRYSFGPRCRDAPQIATTRTSCSDSRTT